MRKQVRRAQFLTAHWKQPAAAQLAVHLTPAVPFPDFSGAASSCIDACRACLHANAPHMSACGHACVFARSCLHFPSLICAYRSGRPQIIPGVPIPGDRHLPP
jgi:hypothetical protein